MITDAIFAAFSAPFLALIGLFPQWTPPSWLCTSTSGSCLPAKVQGLGPYLAAGDRFFPIHEAFDLVPLTFALLLAVVTFKTVVFAYRLVRG